MAIEQLQVADTGPQDKRKFVSIVGRTVWRVILHVGVATTPPPRSTNEKSIFHKDYPGAKPYQRPTADEMYVVTEGLYVRVGEYEKLVPFSVIYECDLAPV